MTRTLRLLAVVAVLAMVLAPAGASAVECTITNEGALPTILGTLDTDVICDSAIDEVISASGGDDRIVYGGGNDTVNGGTGSDTIDFSGSAGPVHVDLDEGVATLGTETLSLVSIERVIGTTGN